MTYYLIFKYLWFYPKRRKQYGLLDIHTMRRVIQFTVHEINFVFMFNHHTWLSQIYKRVALKDQKNSKWKYICFFYNYIIHSYIQDKKVSSRSILQKFWFSRSTCVLEIHDTLGPFHQDFHACFHWINEQFTCRRAKNFPRGLVWFFTCHPILYLCALLYFRKLRPILIHFPDAFHNRLC